MPENAQKLPAAKYPIFVIIYSITMPLFIRRLSGTRPADINRLEKGNNYYIRVHDIPEVSFRHANTRHATFTDIKNDVSAFFLCVNTYRGYFAPCELIRIGVEIRLNVSIRITGCLICILRGNFVIDFWSCPFEGFGIVNLFSVKVFLDFKWFDEGN